MAMLMLVIMVMPSTVLMAMLGVVITFCHSMPMIMVTMFVIMFVIMIVIMTVTILTHFAILWVVLNAWCWLWVAVGWVMCRHGSCCSNCSSMLALNVEMGDQGLSLSAKDVLKVYSSLLTGENLQE